MKKKTNTEYNSEKIALKVSFLNMTVNIILTIIKIVVGIIANSGSMITDAINSISDVFSGIVVLIGIKFSSKNSDKEHPYGHERFECVAAIILAVALLVTGLFIAHEAIEALLSKETENIGVPKSIAIFVAIFCIAIKETMYWITRYHAKSLQLSSLMGMAWDNRSDVFATLCVLIGIVGARFDLPVLDIIARLIICLLITKAAYQIFKDSITKMIDASCPSEFEDQIIRCAKEEEGVLDVDAIKTRVFGNKIYVEIQITADPNISLKESYKISQSVHKSIENTFSNIKHITVQIKPSKEI